jgi:hypothetical protein
VKAWDAFALGKRSRPGLAGASQKPTAPSAPTTSSVQATHALHVDPRSVRTRSILGSCTAAGCTWTVRGALDVYAAERAFARAHLDG